MKIPFISEPHSLIWLYFLFKTSLPLYIDTLFFTCLVFCITVITFFPKCPKRYIKCPAKLSLCQQFFPTLKYVRWLFVSDNLLIPLFFFLPGGTPELARYGCPLDLVQNCSLGSFLFPGYESLLFGFATLFSWSTSCSSLIRKGAWPVKVWSPWMAENVFIFLLHCIFM